MPRRTHWWADDVGARLRFERGAATEHPSLRIRRLARPPRVVYTLLVEVPAYDLLRRVRIEFAARRNRRQPKVTVDGPPSQRHRFKDNSLCMWFARHPTAQRWEPEDGLLSLIDRIRIHLFQEERHRRTGDWSGPEIHGGPPVESEAA